ncbi:MAG: OB-fold protein [Brevundimonas sp.]
MSMTVNLYTPYLLSVGWLAIGVGLVGLIYMFRTAPKAALLAAQSVVTGPPPRDFVAPELTWTVLGKKVEGRTSVQVDGITKTYAGKWIRVCGRIYDVADRFDQIAVDMKEDGADGYSSVRAKFSQSWKDQLSVLNKNEWICVVGKIEHISYGGTMTDCEIEHVGEPAPNKDVPKPRAPRKRASKA